MHTLGTAPCKRGNLGLCPRPWRGATTDRSKTQQLARFRALPDPDDEGHEVGRGGGRTRTDTGVRKPTGRPGPARCG